MISKAGIDFKQEILKQGKTLCLLALIWLFYVLIANPSGAFPLNDDWNYARSVKALLEEHKLLITQWSLAASIPQIFGGALLCAPMGFSFETLRISTCVLAFIAIAGTYLLSLHCSGNRRLAFLSALTIAGSPLFFNLSLTFMTDVPFLALATLCLLSYARLLQAKKATILALLFAVISTTAACTLRQTGLVLAIAFAGTYISSKIKQNGRTATVTAETLQEAESEPDINRASSASKTALNPIAVGLAPLIVSVTAIAIFQFWLGKEAGSLYSYRMEQAYLAAQFAKGPVFVVGEAFRNIIKALIYVGLFALPLIPMTAPDFIARLNRKERFLSLGLGIESGILLCLGLVFMGALMPLADNIFYNFGLGPLLLGLEGSESISAWPTAPTWLMLSITILGCVGAAHLVALMVTYGIRRLKKQNWVDVPAVNKLLSVCMNTMFLYMFIICIRGFFDRYLLFPFLLVIPLLISASRIQTYAVSPEAEQEKERNKNEEREKDNNKNYTAEAATTPKAPPVRSEWMPGYAIGVPLLMVLSYFAIAATHDYLEWNRSRWQAVSYFLEDPKHSALDLDGGLEFNGWYSYDPRYKDKGLVFSTSMKHGDAYALTLSSVKGYHLVKAFPFKRWLPAGSGEILLLQKIQ